MLASNGVLTPALPEQAQLAAPLRGAAKVVRGGEVRAGGRGAL